MKSITIKGETRENVGKVSAKALRRSTKTPCILYGGKEVLHFSAEELAFSKLVYTPEVHTVVINLEDGTSINVIMQDIQFHPVTDKILHVDFYELHEDKEVVMSIPIKIEGSALGVLKGGVLRVGNRSLKVKALPKNLPDFITVDISKLEIGDKVYISALQTKKYAFQHPDNMVVCQVRTARTAVKEEASEEVEVATKETPEEKKEQ